MKNTIETSINRFDTAICIMGPTSSGKSNLAFEIARQLPCEIISVDSVNVYRGMDIGSAKPSIAERKEVNYHLIDIRDPTDPYSVANFVRDALITIKEIFGRGKIPLLVGGTMLYFHSLLFGLSDLPKTNKNVRKKILKEAEEIGWGALYKRLQFVDPESATRIHPNDHQRLQRALEIFNLTGKSLTTIKKKSKKSIFSHKHISIIIAPNDRQYMHDSIKKRFNTMIKKGLIFETQKLYERKDLNINLPAIRSIGYRQVWEYLDHKITFEQMNELAIIATRQLAKRQLTWLHNWPEKSYLLDSCCSTEDLAKQTIDILGLSRIQL